MKLLAIRLARSIWLVPQYFLNPKGFYLRPALALLKERYRFQISPSEHATSNDPDGLRFEHGAFESANGTIAIQSLILHGNGIVADTRSSTADSDAFIADALDFVTSEFKLPSQAEMLFKKAYVSELNVSFERAPQILNPGLTPFLNDLTPHVIDERSPRAGFIGLIYGPDQSLSDKPAFRFEREIGTPFNQNRYYSFAPMPTNDHIHLLEQLERVV